MHYIFRIKRSICISLPVHLQEDFSYQIEVFKKKLKQIYSKTDTNKE